MDDSELGDGFDDNFVMQPIQLPKSSLGIVFQFLGSCLPLRELAMLMFFLILFCQDANLKEETESMIIKSENQQPIIVEGDIASMQRH